MSDLDDKPTLDMSTIDSLRALETRGSAGLMARLVQYFLESSAKIASELRDAAETDPAAMARSAHKLKSSSAQLGAMKLASLAKEIEMLGRAGKLDGASRLVRKLSVELEAAGEALSALVR